MRAKGGKTHTPRVRYRQQCVLDFVGKAHRLHFRSHAGKTSVPFRQDSKHRRHKIIWQSAQPVYVLLDMLLAVSSYTVLTSRAIHKTTVPFQRKLRKAFASSVHIHRIAIKASMCSASFDQHRERERERERERAKESTDKRSIDRRSDYPWPQIQTKISGRLTSQRQLLHLNVQMAATS